MITLRCAEREDALFLFDLINDSECRKNSLNSDMIMYESHVEWLDEILGSKNRKLYILVDDTEPIGQGRLELTGDVCRISYSIIPERRGCGYGETLIRLLNNAMLEDFPTCTCSYGEVLKNNISSQKIFEKLGYSAKEYKDYFCYKKQVTHYDVNL